LPLPLQFQNVLDEEEVGSAIKISLGLAQASLPAFSINQISRSEHLHRQRFFAPRRNVSKRDLLIEFVEQGKGVRSRQGKIIAFSSLALFPDACSDSPVGAQTLHLRKKTAARYKAGRVKDTLHDMCMAQTHYAIFFARNRGR
jgi:hypothetical protein